MKFSIMTGGTVVFSVQRYFGYALSAKLVSKENLAVFLEVLEGLDCPCLIVLVYYGPGTPSFW